MKKEKKIVKYEQEATSDNNYGISKEGKIIKVEASSKKSATGRRIASVILWLLAIAAEVLGILNIFGKVSLPDKFTQTTWLIILIVVDLIFFVIASLLWKKANHIDPKSEKNKTTFWMWNNLGTILSVLAFLPIIIVVFTNKDMDKKSKGLVGGIAIVALLIAGISSYDFNPVSSEQLEAARNEVLNVAGTDKVYWAPNSKKYHVDPDCPAFSQSETVYEGTVAAAYEKGLTDPCRRCIPENHDHNDHNNEE